MNLTAVAAVITAVAGLALGAWKIAQDAAAMRRLEQLNKLRGELPESSLAQQSIDEALDWIALKVVQKERLPLPHWVRFLGLGLYMLGMLGVMASVFPLIGSARGSDFASFFQSNDFPKVIWATLGAVVSFIVSMAGMLMVSSNSRSRNRFAELKSLLKREEQEIIARHKRHQIDGTDDSSQELDG